jgi:hypothetical protein
MDQKNQSGNKTPVSWRTPRDLACIALALILGLVVGWLDLHVTEVAVTILALLVSGMLPGLIQPRAAWRWAILIAIGLPVMALVAVKSGMRTAETAQPDVLITIVAMVFASLGVYAGVLVRYLTRSLASR